MLKELLPGCVTVHTTLRDYRVRYSLNSFLYLELLHKPIDELLKTGCENWSIDDVLHILRAGLCHLSENDRAVTDRRFEHISPSLAQLGEEILPDDLPLLRLELASAILAAFPAVAGEPEKSGDNLHRERDLRTMYVDIMHRPEPEFWGSTYGEIISRSESWLEAKGLKDRPITVQEFED